MYRLMKKLASFEKKLETCRHSDVIFLQASTPCRPLSIMRRLMPGRRFLDDFYVPCIEQSARLPDRSAMLISQHWNSISADL